MQKLALMLLGVVLVLSSIFPAITVPADRSQHNPAVTESLPAYDGGFGYDSVTATMYDHNGFAYSYLPDGIVRLVLPWGYTTYFSFGMTASYLGVAQKVTALSYTWTWAATATAQYNDTGVFEGYDYTFKATNTATLAWSIQMDFYADGANMKVTHELTNGYPNALTGAEFWFIFDLTHTPEPSVTTNAGTFYPPLYSALPSTITWCRLSNEFQFDWRDAVYPNGHAYLGSGSIVGLAVDILGIGILVGDIASGATVTIDPYFSGVTRTWAATGNSYSGIAASWSPVGVPSTGDNITFDGTSVFNCQWNTSVVIGNFLMAGAYTGAITTTAPLGTEDMTISVGVSGGTFSGSVSWANKISINGNFTVGTYTRFITGTMIFQGTDKTINVVTGVEPYRMVVSGIYSSISTGIMYSEDINITSTGQLTLGSNNIAWRMGTIRSSWKCDGQLISGSTGVFNPYFTGASTKNQLTFNPGNVDSAILSFTATSSIPANRYVVITTDMSCVGITVISAHAACTISVNQSKPLVTSYLTIQTRGIFNSDNTITCSGNFDSSAGTFTEGTSTVEMTGASKTLKTGAGQSFYNLDISGTISTTSSVNVTHDLDVSGTLTNGAGKTMTWVSNGTMTNTGEIAGTGEFAIDLATDYAITLGTVTAPTTVGIPSWRTTDGTLSWAVDTTLRADLTIEGNATLDPNDMITIFADDMELDLSASPSSELWNATVNAGVTVTLTDDVIVQLRVTILGTVAGADFIEPEPAFTSTPDLTATPLTVYEYAITQAYWDALSVVEAPAWLSYLDGSLVGVPAESDVGFSNVSLLLTWNDMTTYQNFTVYVAYTPTVDMPWFTTTMSLVLSLVLGFGCLILGLVFQMHYLTFFSGLIWLFSALGVYSDINIGWTVLSIALGMMLMMFGGAKIAGE